MLYDGRKREGSSTFFRFGDFFLNYFLNLDILFFIQHDGWQMEMEKE